MIDFNSPNPEVDFQRVESTKTNLQIYVDRELGICVEIRGEGKIKNPFIPTVNRHLFSDLSMEKLFMRKLAIYLNLDELFYRNSLPKRRALVRLRNPNTES